MYRRLICKLDCGCKFGRAGADVGYDSVYVFDFQIVMDTQVSF